MRLKRTYSVTAAQLDGLHDIMGGKSVPEMAQNNKINLFLLGRRGLVAQVIKISVSIFIFFLCAAPAYGGYCNPDHTKFPSVGDCAVCFQNAYSCDESCDFSPCQMTAVCVGSSCLDNIQSYCGSSISVSYGRYVIDGVVTYEYDSSRNVLWLLDCSLFADVNYCLHFTVQCSSTPPPVPEPPPSCVFSSCDDPAFPHFDSLTCSCVCDPLRIFPPNSCQYGTDTFNANTCSNECSTLYTPSPISVTCDYSCMSWVPGCNDDENDTIVYHCTMVFNPVPPSPYATYIVKHDYPGKLYKAEMVYDCLDLRLVGTAWTCFEYSTTEGHWGYTYVQDIADTGTFSMRGLPSACYAVQVAYDIDCRCPEDRQFPAGYFTRMSAVFCVEASCDPQWVSIPFLVVIR